MAKRTPPPKRDPKERFWEMVNKTSNCWLWTGSTKSQGGYGRFVIDDNRRILAHRYAYELLVGPITDGMQLDHICRIRHCVNPEHLRVVTRKENMENRRGAAAHSRSGVRGVIWVGGRIQKWRVQVRHNGFLHHGGYFDSLDAAKSAAIAKRNQLFTCNELDRIS